MIVYGLKNCDTCRKAVRALAAVLHDVRETPVDRAQLSEWYEQFGPALINTRSTTWRGLNEHERARVDTVEGAIDLLATHPALMKRPVIDAGGTLCLGWSRDVQAALL